MKSRVHVYALIDPREGRARYVGQSVNPAVRLEAHLASSCNQGLALWLSELKAAGLAPELRMLESGPREDATSMESKWIEAFGDDLLNDRRVGGRGGGRPGAGRKAPHGETGSRTVRLPLYLWRALDSLAVARRSTVNALVRDACEGLTLSVRPGGES